MTSASYTTSAERFVPIYHWSTDGHRPEHVAWLDDGRVFVRYPEGETHFFASRPAFQEVHPCVDIRETGEREDVEAPSLPETFALAIDWAEVHHVFAELERTRRGTGFGSIRGAGDVFGGEYHHTSYRTLADLVRLVASTDQLAREAWNLVHGAARASTDIERVRAACRVAIACSAAYRVLHRAGLVSDPSRRICGTGEGYGLTGLRWLAGASQDLGCTSEEVEVFAAGGSLPTIAAGEVRR